MAKQELPAPTPVARNLKGLVEALFQSIDRLNAREIDAEHARALSHTAKTIVACGHLEIEHRKLLGDQGSAALTSIIIEAEPAKLS